MNFLIIVLCSMITAKWGHSQEIAEKDFAGLAVHKECQSDPNTYVNYDEIRKADKGKPYNRTLVGAHSLCITTKSGVQDANGNIDREKFKRQLQIYIKDDNKLNETMNCVKERKSPQETALNIVRCYFRATGPQARFRMLRPEYAAYSSANTPLSVVTLVWMGILAFTTFGMFPVF